MSINETFIKKVFERVVEYKPRLAAFMDEDDDMFDVRELANNISKTYPWPIGVEIRRLLSGNMEDLNRGRIDQIFKTIERTMQFLSYVLVIQLLEHKLKNDLEIPDSFKKEFTRRFTTTTMGNFVWLIRSISDIMVKNDITPFMEEMTDIFNKKFMGKLDFWTPQRNELGHYQINLSDEEIEVRCHEYMDLLGDILADIAFVVKYPLVTITEIQLIKPKREDVHYLHNMLILNSASSSFIGKDGDFNQFTDTHSVILVKSIKNAADAFLNLSPLIIDTHSEKMESREKLTKLKKDVYLYSKWELKKGVLHYIGTEATEKPDMRLVSFYDNLVKEYKEIMSVFSLEEELQNG